MRVAFVQNELREMFSFMLMSSKLKESGHEVDVFVINNNKDLGSVELYKPDLIGFSSSVVSFEKDLYNAKILKNKINAKIIFGGAYPTYNPADVIKHDCIDMLCIGEGIDAIVELCNNIERTDINNLWFKKTNISNLYNSPFSWWTTEIIENEIKEISNIDDWSMPDYNLYYQKYKQLRDKPTKPVYIVRGCPYNCQFCYNPAYNEMYKNKGKIFQCMSVEKAIAQIRWLVDNYDCEYLQFLSDNMTINKVWLKSFLKMYKKKFTPIGIVKEVLNKNTAIIELKKLPPLPFFINCRANEVTKEIVELLKESGCNRVDFGVEHGNDFIRNNILKRNMSKKQIIDCGQWFNEANIRIQTTNIFGLPHENFNNAWESVELNRNFKTEISKACILQPFENTGVYNYAKEKGLLKDDFKYSGTTYQIGVKDNRSDESKIKIADEKQIIRLSYLFDFFVKCRLIPKFIGYIICSLPLNFLYKKYYENIFKKHGKKYKGLK